MDPSQDPNQDLNQDLDQSLEELLDQDLTCKIPNSNKTFGDDTSNIALNEVGHRVEKSDELIARQLPAITRQNITNPAAPLKSLAQGISINLQRFFSSI